MIYGSTAGCLRNLECEPLFQPFHHVTFEGVEAYGAVTPRRPLDAPHCAASTPRHRAGPFAFHSIIFDEDCVHPFDAIGMAADLHAECLIDQGDDLLSYYAEECSHMEVPLSLSEAVGNPWHNHAIQELDQPHPQRHHLFDFGDDSHDEFSYEVPGDEGAGIIPHLPTQQLHQQPHWIQILFRTWTSAIGEPGEDDELSVRSVRSWYLHPDRYTMSEVWRPIRFAPNFDFWFNDLRAVWHDMLEHDQPVEAFVVEPAPQRPNHDAKYLFDLIICQEVTHVPLLRPSLVVSQLIGGNFVRLHTVAALLPAFVSKWSLIYLVGNEHFCAGPSLPVDFHRLCEVKRGQQMIHAVPEEVRNGDCLTIDIFPPSQIEEEDDDLLLLSTTMAFHHGDGDEVAFMGRNPFVVREQPDALDLPAEDPESPTMTDDHDTSEQPQEYDYVNPAFSVLIFTKDKDGVVGRIKPRNRDELYDFAAEMLEIPANRLLRLYELPAPPDDLVDTMDRIWIAQRLGDLNPGAIGKLILLDVVFCDELPRLEPEGIRNVRILPSPSTKRTLLQVLGIEPYCRHWPCLTQLNHRFLPEQAPFNVHHGDYIKIVIGPPAPHCGISTRLAALILHHGLSSRDFPRIVQEVPDFMDLDQMPNPDVHLDELEFDHPRLELWQASTALHIPLKTARLDETEDIQRRIQEVVDENEMRNEDAEDINLDDLAGPLRNLFDPWNEIATTWHDHQRWAVVAVWYISHLRWRICTAPRMVWLSSDVGDWQRRITEAWSDQIDQTDAIDTILVHPTPHRREPNVAGHIFLVQHQRSPDEHAALVSLQDTGYRNGEVDRQAMVLPIHTTHESLLVVANRLQECLTRITEVLCTTRSGTFRLNQEGMIGRPGQSYTVLIERVAQLPAAPWAGDNIFPVPIAATAPPFIREIHDVLLQQRNLQPHQPLNLRILSWYLDHVLMRKCLYARYVDLPVNPNHWLLAIIQQWPDHYDPRVPVEGCLVRPTPSTSQWQTEDTIHVIIHQRVIEGSVSVLSTSFDQTQNARNAAGIQRAIVQPNNLRKQDMLQALDLDEWCSYEGNQCHVAFGAIPILPDVPFQSSSGFSFRVYFTDAPQQVWPAFQDEQVQADAFQEDDALHLLQLSKHLPEPTQEAATIKIDLQSIWHQWFLCDEHFLLPNFNFDFSEEWRPECYEWLRLPLWHLEEPCSEIHIYYDGSYLKQDQHSGIAVAAFAFDRFRVAICRVYLIHCHFVCEYFL